MFGFQSGRGGRRRPYLGREDGPVRRVKIAAVGADSDRRLALYGRGHLPVKVPDCQQTEVHIFSMSDIW